MSRCTQSEVEKGTRRLLTHRTKFRKASFAKTFILKDNRAKINYVEPGFAKANGAKSTSTKAKIATTKFCEI